MDQFAQTQLWLFRLRGVLVHIQWRWPQAARKRPELLGLVALKKRCGWGAKYGCTRRMSNTKRICLIPVSWRVARSEHLLPWKNISLLTADTHISYTWTRFTHFTETKLTHSPLVIHRFDPVPLHLFNIVLQEGVVVFKCQGSPWKTDRRNLTMTTLPLCPKVWCTRHLCFTEENRDW